MADITNIEDIIAREGRFTARAAERWPTVTVANIDFDILYGQLSVAIYYALHNYEPFIRQYTGTFNEIETNMDLEIDHLIHQALNELWNRLRNIAESYHRETRNTVFQRKAPSVENFMLPRFIASLLSSIGPLRIMDTLRETIVIYAPASSTSANFGRSAPTPIDLVRVHHIQRALREINIPLASIQGRGSTGSYFTTAYTRLVDDNRYNVVGYFHHSHYSRNDTIMAMLLSDPTDEENPFEDLSTNIAHVTGEDLMDVFRTLAPPALDMNENGPPRHVGATFSINRFGIAPASDTPVSGRGEGIYVLGRGCQRELCCTLARDLTQQEIDMIIRHRIIHGGPETPAAPLHAVGANAPPPAV